MRVDIFLVREQKNISIIAGNVFEEEALFDRGDDPNDMTADGFNALHVATVTDSVEIA